MNNNGSSLLLLEELIINNDKEEEAIDDNEIDVSQDTKNALAVVDPELIEAAQNSSLEEFLEYNLAKRRHWFTPLTREEIMVWNSHRISSPLLQLPHSLRFLAVKMFRHLLKYMGDRKTGKTPHHHLHQYIRLSISSPEELKDEAYVQIIKQLTNHPDNANAIKGWSFFSVIASTYPPSEELYRCLIKYLFDIIKDESKDKLIVQKANYIAIRLIKTFSSKRRFPPSEKEVALIERMKPIKLSIYFYNGNAKTIKVESYWAIRDIKNLFMNENQMSVTKIPYYSIYEICAKQNILEERYIDDNQPICDILSLWAIETNESQEKGIKIDFKLCLKIHLYYLFNDDDINTITMHYMQTCFEVIQGNYSLTEEEICQLGAYQILIEQGKKKINEVVNILQTTIKQYIPLNRFNDLNKKEWIQKIMTVYTSLQDKDISIDQARIAYLNIIKENPLWESTQFLCRYSNLSVSSDESREKKANLDNIPNECVLGINPHGIVIASLERKEVLRIPFEKIPSWAVNNDLILVVVQEPNKEWRKYYFESSQTKLFQILMDSYTGILGGKDLSIIMSANDQTGKMFASMPAVKLKEGQSFRSMQASTYVNTQDILIA